MSVVTEIVTMSLDKELLMEEFILIVEGLEKNFHSKQPGFIDTELLYNENKNEWIMIQHWETMEALKASSKKMFKEEASAAFVKTLNPKSVKMVICSQLKKW